MLQFGYPPSSSFLVPTHASHWKYFNREEEYIISNNNSCESHLRYTNIEWIYLSTQCLYLISSSCTLPIPDIFLVSIEK